jgi:hypothetical protein
VSKDEIKLNLSEALGAVDAPSVQQLTIFIPNKDKNGKEVKNFHFWVKEAQKILSIIGGGATTMPPADGTWLDPEKDIAKLEKLKDEDLVWEKTTILYTYIQPHRFEKNLNLLREFLHRFGRETKQGEVVCEFDGEFFRISKYDPK